MRQPCPVHPRRFDTYATTVREGGRKDDEQKPEPTVLPAKTLLAASRRTLCGLSFPARKTK